MRWPSWPAQAVHRRLPHRGFFARLFLVPQMFSSCHSTANVLYTLFFVLCAAWFVDWKLRSCEKKEAQSLLSPVQPQQSSSRGRPSGASHAHGTPHISSTLAQRSLLVLVGSSAAPSAPVFPPVPRWPAGKNLLVPVGATSFHHSSNNRQTDRQACGDSIGQRGRMHRRLFRRSDRRTCARTRLGMAVAVAAMRTTDSCCCRLRMTSLRRRLYPHPPLPL
jgi:hypothetical protein